jgi:hypothetical protein
VRHYHGSVPKGPSADAERPNTDIITSTPKKTWGGSSTSSGVEPKLAGVMGHYIPADEIHLQHLYRTVQRKYIAATNTSAMQAIVGQLDVVVNVCRGLIPSDIVVSLDVEVSVVIVCASSLIRRTCFNAIRSSSGQSFAQK